MPHTLLIDASNYLKRAFHTPGVAALDLLPAQVARMTARLTHLHQPDALIFVEDHPLPGIRYQLLPGYKKTRRENPSKPSPGELTETIRPHLDEWGIATFRSSEWIEQGDELIELGHEADDSIATLSAMLSAEGHQVSILSRDKDLLALVSDRVRVLLPIPGQSETILDTPEKVRDTEGVLVKKHLGVLPSQILDWKTLCGDKSDDVPSVGVDRPWGKHGEIRRIGFTDHRAAALLREQGSLDMIWQNRALLPKKEYEWLTACWEHHIPLMRQILALKRNVSTADLDLEKAAIQHLEIPKHFPTAPVTLG